MASPFKQVNDCLLELYRYVEGIAEKYPDERIIHSSTGFMVKRKGDKEKLGFPTYCRYRFGAVILTDKRAHFSFDGMSTYAILMKGLYLIAAFMMLLLLVILVLLSFLMIYLCLIISPVLLMLIPIIITWGLMIYRLFSSEVDLEWKDMEEIRINECQLLFGFYDKVDLYDGKYTYQLVTYGDIPQDLKEIIEI